MLKNARIAARLNSGFGVIILLFLLLGIFTRIKMETVADLTTQLYEHPFTVSVNLINCEADIIRMQVGVRDALLAANQEELGRKLKEIENAEQNAYAHLEVVKTFYLGNKKDVEDTARSLGNWKPSWKMVIALMKEGRRDEAVALHKGEAALPAAELMGKLAVIEDFAARKATSFVEDAKTTANRTYMWIYTLALLTGVLSAAIAFFTSRSITVPLTKAVDSANRISAGSLNVSLPAMEWRDEVGDLIQAFGRMMTYLREIAGFAEQIAARDLNCRVEPKSADDVLGNAFSTMIYNLRTMLTEIRESANVVASSVSEILVTTTQVATGIAETATSVSQTTATVEEVKQTALLSTEKSKNVSEYAQQAIQVAEQGSSAVTETVEGINHIKELMGTVAESVVMLSEQTQAIGEIIAVVNDLAHQSNLLAVNAAIEASKAGEEGKGFVVVAQEIKNLADQSKQATEQVRAILGDIQKATGKSVLAAEQASKAVDSGVKQADESGRSIRNLAESINKSAQAATQIAASSQQQLAGTEQVALAMEVIKQAAQQNAMGTKQAEQAAHTLNELGQKLKGMVDKYTL